MRNIFPIRFLCEIIDIFHLNSKIKEKLNFRESLSFFLLFSFIFSIYQFELQILHSFVYLKIYYEYIFIIGMYNIYLCINF